MKNVRISVETQPCEPAAKKQRNNASHDHQHHASAVFPNIVRFAIRIRKGKALTASPKEDKTNDKAIINSSGKDDIHVMRWQ